FLSLTRGLRRATLFPYTTLFRSPSTALRTANCFLASRNTAMDSGIGFQLIFSPGAPAPAKGIARLTRWPMIASAISATPATHGRSEEHTSELQSREKLVCRLLLE